MHTPAEDIDQSPYGEVPPLPKHPPTNGHEMTRRGKAALGIGAVILSGCGLFGYQTYAESEAKEQESALKIQALELQKIREVNQAATKRQTNIDACVKAQAIKASGPSAHRDVVDTCRAQYADTSDGSDMQPSASSQGGDDGGAGINTGALVAGGVIVLFLAGAAKRGQRNAQ